jgi:hypothetical protein
MVLKYGICSGQDLKLGFAKGKAGSVITLNVLLRIGVMLLVAQLFEALH